MDKLLHAFVGYVFGSLVKVLGGGKITVLVSALALGASKEFHDTRTHSFDGWDMVATGAGAIVPALSPRRYDPNREIERINKELRRQRDSIARADTMIAALGRVRNGASAGGSPVGPFDVPQWNNSAGQTLGYEDDMSAYDGLTMTDLWDDHNVAPCIAPSDADFTTPNVNEMTVQDGLGLNGNPCLRVHYPGDFQSGNALRTWGIPTLTSSEAFFAIIKYRITLGGSLTTSMGVKFFERWHTTGNDRIQWPRHFQGPCVSAANLTYAQIQDNSADGSTCLSAQPLGPFFVDLADGAWHEYAFAYKSCTSTGVGGYAMEWVDGTLLTACHPDKVGITPPSGLKEWCSQTNMDDLAVNEGLNERAAFGGVQTTDTVDWLLDLGYYVEWKGTSR